MKDIFAIRLTIRKLSTLFLLGGLLLSSVCFSGEEKGLSDGEGYVLVSSRLEDVRHVVFSGFQSKNKFTVNREATLIKVPSGKYYYKSAVSVFQNVTFYSFKEPDTDSYTFDVKPGAITYIGEWFFRRKNLRNDVDWDVSVEFPPYPMLQTKMSFPWVTRYPLYVAKTGSPPLALSWN